LKSTDSPVLVSASSADGGGLLAYERGRIDRIDNLTTMGLCIAGGKLARLLKSPDKTETMTELLVYDDRGVERYYRFDGFGSPHDIAWSGSQFLVVASIQNTILWISRTGDVERVWSAPGEADSWHINGLARAGDEWYVSVFGRFARHRGWAEELRGTSGLLLRISDNKEICTGLSQPHSPRFADGKWLICNSATREIVQIDPGSGKIERRLKLDGYTRGLAVFDDVLLVGESAGRYAVTRANAAICAIDRKTWKVVDRTELKAKEIYELLPVPRPLLQGARAGFRTSRTRNAEEDHHYLFRLAGVEPVRMWAIGEPLPPEAMKISMTARVPEVMHCGDSLEIPVWVTNLGGAILVSAPPNPVSICYRWTRSDDGAEIAAGEWIHTPLPRSAPPGDLITATALVAAPDDPGEYVLVLTLLQENVAWFDHVNSDNATLHGVTILDRRSR